MVSQITEAECNNDYNGILDIEFPEVSKFDYLPDNVARSSSSYLSVQEGCNKFCTFCLVPYTRGAEFSRPLQDIISEARVLISQGVKEIILLGQNVNAYHGERAKNRKGSEVGLGYLIRVLAEIDGLERVRYLTSHPIDMDDDLIRAHGEVPILMPFLHLPIQSGSDRILRKMNRRHKIADYRNIVEKLLVQCPHLKLSSDFIVGFPGESEKDFNHTLKIVEDIQFLQSYSFKYSPRPGTPGALLEDQISDQVKTERLAILQDLLTQCQRVFNQSSIGKVMPVLLDRRGRKEKQLVGRTPFMQPVHVEAPGKYLDHLVEVKLISAMSNSLRGEVVHVDKQGKHKTINEHSYV